MTNHINQLLTSISEEEYKSTYKVVYEDLREETLYGIDTLLVKHSKWKVNRPLKIAELKEYLKIYSNENRLYIELPINLTNKDALLAVHPYVLGVLIGDGGLTTNSLRITSTDIELIDKVRSLLPEGVKIKNNPNYPIEFSIYLEGVTRNPINKYLKDNSLKVTSDKKFIPKEYLNSSYEQRLELIKGLMDTDGTIGKSGCSTYCTVSKQLALDFQYLIRSIGGLAKIHIKTTHFTYKGIYKEGKPAYIVNIRVRSPKILFSLNRKLLRAPEKNQYSEGLRLRIKSIEKIDE